MSVNVKVSILMGIYNCETTLGQALDSIIKQTYQNWETILYNDGSEDRTYEIALEYAAKDNRITVLTGSENRGLAGSLNKCLVHAKGEYIMRQDGDDYVEADRIEKQVRYMENNPCDVCGTGAFVFDHTGVWGLRLPALRPGRISMAKGVPVIHATVIMKKTVLTDVNGYTENKLTRQRLEDYDLWMKLFEKGCIFHNIREPLYYYRVDKNSYHRRKRRFRLAEVKMRLKACNRLKLPFRMKLFALKPLVLMLMPPVFVQHMNTKRLVNALKNHS